MGTRSKYCRSAPFEDQCSGYRVCERRQSESARVRNDQSLHTMGIFELKGRCRLAALAYSQIGYKAFSDKQGCGKYFDIMWT
jgi:hypothetical protein